MRSFTRRVATATAAALLCAGAAVPPAAAGIGPAVIDDHDSHVAPRAYDLSSSTGGTVYATDDGGFGRLYLAPGTMSTGSPLVDLGPRPQTHRGTTISGSRIAMPIAGITYSSPVTSMRSCQIGICPTMSTGQLPAGWEYVGNADDRVVIFNSATNQISLANWTGSPVAITNTYNMPETFADAPTVVADTAGLAISGNGNVVYVNRATGNVANLGYGDGAVISPTYVVWHAVGVGEPPNYETRIYRAARSAPTPTVIRTLHDSPGIESLAATDFGAAWLIPNGDSDGTASLWTMPYDGVPALYARPITTNGLSPFLANAQVLINDRLAGVPGIYRVTPGSYSGALTGIVPVRGAITMDLAVSNGRAIYADDMTSNLPMFTRTVTNGSPGPESLVTDTTAGSLGLSGPYYAHTRPNASSAHLDLVYGRVGGATATRTYPISEIGRVQVSGRRALLTGGARARVIDIPTGTVTDLGAVFASIWGEYVATIDQQTGLVQRRNLDTGAVQTVRSAICTSNCVDDDSWYMAMWGHEVVYAFLHGGAAPGAVSGLWNGNTGATTATPMLTEMGELATTEIAYWSGLLLVAHHGAVVKLYDMRNGAAQVTVDSFAEEPFAMDGNVVAWRPLSNLKAVVRDVRDFVPGHLPETRYIGGVVPAGFGPGLAASAWKPAFLVSQELAGSVVLRSGSAAGPVVRSIPVATLYGELSPVWDGKDDLGADLPHGTYHWSILDGSSAPVTNAAGTAAAAGTVLLSRAAPGTPSLTAPALSTDVTASTSFPVSWSLPGAPAGTRYVLQRSTNSGAYVTVATTTGTSTTVAGVQGTTYRFRVAALDAAGRQGAFSVVRSTMVPFNENAAGTVYGGPWAAAASPALFGGGHRYSATAGATYTFRATGTAIYLIGNRAASYGQFQVSIDGGAYSGLIDAYSATTQTRKVLYARAGLSNAAHTIKVRVYGTARRPYVGIDAVAFLR